MGVPRFFSWVNNNYSVIIDPIIKPNEFYFDLNCLLHPKCFEVAGEILKDHPEYDLIKNQELLETKMFNKIIEYIQEILDYIQPSDLIYIAIDGVAPMAKIKHQRLRRFKSIRDYQIMDSIAKKHKKEVSKHWNSNCITPGTLFMKKILI
jgi:5'-3' exonuclease